MTRTEGNGKRVVINFIISHLSSCVVGSFLNSKNSYYQYMLKLYGLFYEGESQWYALQADSVKVITVRSTIFGLSLE